MKARAYLFDMDGVLVDNCGYHVLAWLELARKYGGRLTERQVIDWMGAPGRDYIVRMFPDETLTASRIDELLREKEACYRDLYRPHLVLREGLGDLLARAQAEGIPCAVVTGGSPANVAFVLDGLAIRHAFACIVDSSQYAHGKPAPDCYLQAAVALGAAAADCVVFEDALNGIAAAQAAGMRVVAITGTNTRKVLESARPDRVVDSFVEI